MIEVTLAGEADFEAWRTAARRLLASAEPPEAVLWRVEAAAADLFAPSAEDAAPAGAAAASAASPLRWTLLRVPALRSSRLRPAGYGGQALRRERRSARGGT